MPRVPTLSQIVSYADEHLRASAAASEGFVDEIIEPGETRERLSWALLTLSGRSGR